MEATLRMKMKYKLISCSKSSVTVNIETKDV